jgi:hypothetical protein
VLQEFLPFPYLFEDKARTLEFFQKFLQKLRDKIYNQVSSLIFSNISPAKPSFIIFLDIDGVCWPDDEFVRQPKYWNLLGNYELGDLLRVHKHFFKRYYDFDEISEIMRTFCFDPSHMERIKKLCQEFDARIVISSSWRVNRTINHLQNVFDLWGIGEYVIGKTKDSQWQLGRENQIGEWIEQNKERVLGFVILDDQSGYELELKFPKRFVECNARVGFDQRAYEKAKNILLTQRKPFANEVIHHEGIALKPPHA